MKVMESRQTALLPRVRRTLIHRKQRRVQSNPVSVKGCVDTAALIAQIDSVTRFASAALLHVLLTLGLRFSQEPVNELL